MVFTYQKVNKIVKQSDVVLKEITILFILLKNLVLIVINCIFFFELLLQMKINKQSKNKQCTFDVLFFNVLSII